MHKAPGRESGAHAVAGGDRDLLVRPARTVPRSEQARSIYLVFPIDDDLAAVVQFREVADQGRGRADTDLDKDQVYVQGLLALVFSKLDYYPLYVFVAFDPLYRRRGSMVTLANFPTAVTRSGSPVQPPASARESAQLQARPLARPADRIFRRR